MSQVATFRRAMLCALVVPALALAACGDDNIPGNAVAKVDDEVISKSSFDHWMNIVAISAQAQQQPQTDAKTAPKPKIPVPPDYTACIADKKKNAPKPAKGQPQPKDSDYKTQCKQEYEGLRDSVMQLLIQDEWISNEAAEQDIKLTDADVKKALEEEKKKSFPKPDDYKKFLQTSGYTEEDVLFRIRLQELSQRLQEKVTKGKDKVTDAQITAYYNKNKKQFAQPERRDLRIVLTKEKGKAEEAKAALANGDSWKTVAKKYSIDQQTKANGGELPAISEGQQEPALDKAIFGAKKGEVTGPVKTQFGYYVFEVSKVTPASQQKLEEAKQTIKSILASEGQQKAMEKFLKDYEKQWKDVTQCQKGFEVQNFCKNAPKPKTTTAGAMTAEGTPTQP